MLPLTLVGLLLAQWWLPDGHLTLPVGLETAVVSVEAGILLLLILKVDRARAIFLGVRAGVPYTLDALRAALAEVLGARAGGVVLGEAGVLWYVVAGWRGRRSSHPMGAVFPGYRRSGYPAVLGAVLMAVVAETSVIHLLSSLWSPSVAWALTILGVYSALWLLGDFHAARLNPTLVSGRQLHLRTGLRWWADIDLDDVIALHERLPRGEEGLKVGLWGEPNVWVETRRPVVVQGPFGIERRKRHIGLVLDEPSAFRDALRGQ